MNKSTSWCSLSRKYSAIVSPVSATLILAPGGSFIWPKTSAVLLITPDSFISFQRSLPSLERSPTPVKMEYPPCWVATLVISSWIRTVLPTPAPPKRPILPPFWYGVSRSITLIPVSRISTSWLCSSKPGALRWIDQCSSLSRLSKSSMVSPTTLKSLPSVFSPIGTFIESPVAATCMSLYKPSEAASIMQRTVLFPICWATSITAFLPLFSTSRASLILGRFSVNFTSTTGPITCVILP